LEKVVGSSNAYGTIGYDFAIENASALPEDIYKYALERPSEFAISELI